MVWDVEYTDEFGEWWSGLDEDAQDKIAVSVRLLEMRGPHLEFPHSSKIRSSRHPHMRELRSEVRDDRFAHFMHLTRDVAPSSS